MWHVLNAFAAGIAFSIGVCAGAWMTRTAMTRGILEVNKSLREHADKVEEGLDKYVEHTAVIAKAAQAYVDDREYITALQTGVKNSGKGG